MAYKDKRITIKLPLGLAARINAVYTTGRLTEKVILLLEKTLEERSAK